ncbi:MAG TPA: ABC transporter substrate-binding protein [Candidatus Eisenbacteria bacterium]|nr:ABC transporter substrate-binding protein [Candidatus Eisenbacteria bacterium]
MIHSSLGGRSRAIALGAVAILVIAACGTTTGTAAPAVTTAPGATTAPASGGTGQVGGQVNVWTAWGGGELAAYQEVLKPFIDQTGIQVNLLTIRDQDLQLSNNVAAGTSLPDIANPPNPQRYTEWAQTGIMKAAEDYLSADDLTAYLANTYGALTADNAANGVVDAKHYLMFVKTQVKGLIWYNPKVFTGTAPATWDELNAIQPPSGTSLWCAAFESGDASGWPASDDIANIIMRQSGEQVYVDWYSGKVKWTSPEIKLAYQTFGQKVAADKVYGGPNTVLSTNFQKAGDPLFTTPPGCLFMEQATFMTGIMETNTPGIEAGTDYDFFPHPKFNDQYAGNIEGFADSFVMYNDTPQSRALMAYMMSDQAQQIWVDQGGTLSASKNITKYPDLVFEKAATVVGGAKNILLTAGDQMPSDMQHAFWKSLLDYTNDQSQLDSILASLDAVQASAYTPAP